MPTCCIVTKYEGELLQNPPEGELAWVSMNEALELPMQPWFKRRFPLFFEPGTFEISIVWDEDCGCAVEEVEEKITRLG